MLELGTSYIYEVYKQLCENILTYSTVDNRNMVDGRGMLLEYIGWGFQNVFVYDNNGQEPELKGCRGPLCQWDVDSFNRSLMPKNFTSLIAE